MSRARQYRINVKVAGRFRFRDCSGVQEEAREPAEKARRVYYGRSGTG